MSNWFGGLWLDVQLMRRTRTPGSGAACDKGLPGRVMRGFALICLVLGIYGVVPALGPSLAQTSDTTPAPAGSTGDPTVESDVVGSDVVGSASPRVALVLTFRGAVTPVLDRYLQAAIEQGQAIGAELIVLELDTPGGSVDVTRAINQRILASSLPIAVYVAPAGANAGSAGTFITLAGHLAVMAPGTSIGAASPVGASGEDIGDTMEAKITNILSADIENLAERRGDAAVEWAIAAVEEAATATATQALEVGIIDFIAPDVADLLTQAHGREVQVQGQPRTLNTAAAQIQTLELTGIEQFLNFIANPTIASLLLSLGLLGLFVEIRTPGVGVPGIIGALSLLLALYALGQLDANFAGFALMGLALILFVAEAFTPTFGLFTVGGAIAFVIGGALLFDSTALPVPWATLISLAVFMGGLTLFAGIKGLAAQRRPVVTGSEGLIGQVVTLRTPLDASTDGRVFISGEWWNARLDQGALDAGARVRVLGREGYLLLITAADDARVLDN